MTFSPKDFASSFKDFMDTMNSQQVQEDPVFFRHLSQHFEQDPTPLPVLIDELPKYDHVNLHVALEDYCNQEGRESKIFGFLSEFAGFKSPGLSELVSKRSALPGRAGLTEGPVQYVNLPIDEDKTVACVQLGLYLISDGAKKLAVLMRPGDYVGRNQIYIEVMAADRADAEQFVAVIRSSMAKKNIYRSRIISIESGDKMDTTVKIKFHALPKVSRDEIILPDGLLTRIERHTVQFGKMSQALLEAQRHLKRGLLLYGPPGTGKTLTAMYLASLMTDRTVLLLVGRSLSLIPKTCALARTLQPAMVILEDVDLVAQERTRNDCATPILFELLNEMDGLSKDVDVIFLLTTNRADLLEPALAARPGRVDQACEVPLPDAVCRKRLIELYSTGLTIKVKSMQPFIDRTEGASAAFICELMRKAALFAAEDGLPIVVHDKHLDEALRELAITGGAITRNLLGFQDGKNQ